MGPGVVAAVVGVAPCEPVGLAGDPEPLVAGDEPPGEPTALGFELSSPNQSVLHPMTASTTTSSTASTRENGTGGGLRWLGRWRAEPRASMESGMLPPSPS